MADQFRRLLRADVLLGAGVALALILGALCIACAYAYQWVDGAWNAQVADVFARTGHYAVVYPHEEAFFVPITTGQTVLFPLALVYKLFGVSPITSSAVPLLYMCAALLMMVLLCVRFFAAGGSGRAGSALLGGACVVGSYFFFSLYGRYAYQVLGEGAAMLFLLLACALLGRYMRSGSRASAALCGAMLACALISKTVAICFLLVFALLILLECAVTRRFSASLILWLSAGFLAAFCALEALKFVQLGGGVGAYIHWWKETFSYSFGLSTGGVTGISFAERVMNNLRAAADLFAAGQIPALIVMLLIAPVCYLVSAVARLMKKKDPFNHPARFALLALGLGGDGFVVASVLFTAESMFAERRVLLHGVLFLLFVIATGLDLLRHAAKNRRLPVIAAAALCAGAMACTVPKAAEGIAGMLHYEQSEDAQRSKDVYAFSEAVSGFEDARFYACGWNFAAEAMLLNGLELFNLEYLPPEYDAADNHYLLVESYPVERDLSADYLLTPVWALRPGEETYTIYRIEPANAKE